MREGLKDVNWLSL